MRLATLQRNSVTIGTSRSLSSARLIRYAVVATLILPAAVSAELGIPRSAKASERISLSEVDPRSIAASYGTVTSGFRSPEHNRRVGGVATSYHLTGRALDVQRRKGVSHLTIQTALRAAGFVLLESLDERDHSHFAFSNLSVLTYSNQQSATEIVKTPVWSSLVAADNHGILILDDNATSTAGTAN